jgi:hypothetical protein
MKPTKPIPQNLIECFVCPNKQFSKLKKYMFTDSGYQTWT